MRVGKLYTGTKYMGQLVYEIYVKPSDVIVTRYGTVHDN